MQSSYQIGLLSLIVALSAYLATVRLFTINRLGAITDAPERARLKRLLKKLIIPDALLVLAAVCLFLHIFWNDLFTPIGIDWLERISIWALFLAGLILVWHHLGAWWKSWRA